MGPLVRRPDLLKASLSDAAAKTVSSAAQADAGRQTAAASRTVSASQMPPGLLAISRRQLAGLLANHHLSQLDHRAGRISHLETEPLDEVAGDDADDVDPMTQVENDLGGNAIRADRT